MIKFQFHDFHIMRVHLEQRKITCNPRNLHASNIKVS